MGSLNSTELCCFAKNQPKIDTEAQYTTESPAFRAGEKKDDDEISKSQDEPLMSAKRSDARFVTKTTAEMDKINAAQNRGHRAGVCAEVVTQKQVEDFVKPVHPKTKAEEAELHSILKENEKMEVICGTLPDDAIQDVVNAFYLKDVAQGSDVIKQGDEGTCLYVCTDGSLDIFVARPGSDGKIAPGDRGSKVLTVGKGALFGELALMYSAPRAATVTVTSSKAKLWALDRDAFKCLLVQRGEKSFQKYEGWLSEVEILKPFNHHELATLADAMESNLFDTDEDIIKQGDAGDEFFIVEDGTCSAFISGADGEKEVKTYKAGDYFGEIALITDEPRKATVRATGEGCTVMSISKEGFTNILGPIRDQLSKDISKYPKYAAFLKN